MVNLFRLGDYDLDTKEDGEQYLNVDQVIVHPNFSSSLDHIYDIALLRLSKEATITRYVKPICLPAARSRIPVGTKCHFVGKTVCVCD